MVKQIGKFNSLTAENRENIKLHLSISHDIEKEFLFLFYHFTNHKFLKEFQNLSAQNFGPFHIYTVSTQSAMLSPLLRTNLYKINNNNNNNNKITQNSRDMTGNHS